MKTIFTFLSLIALPIALSAQPLIATNEYYHIGDVVSMVNCEPPTADSAGTGMTWDFSGVSTTGGIATTYIMRDTSTVFSANTLVVLPDGSVQYVQESSTDSYVQGMDDASSHVTTSYNNFDISKRPFTYGTHQVDSYRVNAPAISEHGTGYLTSDGDGYGTLITPAGTYGNVLRIRRHITEVDTVAGGTELTLMLSYLWFDTVHTSPLFRIDSVTTIMGSSQTAGYLESPAGVVQVSSNAAPVYTGYMHNTQLDIAGPFISGNTYEVVVYDIIGNKVSVNELVATGSSQRIDMQETLPAGIYIVAITGKNNPADRNVIKVPKQQ